MDQLPTELIETILCNQIITIQDVCNFSVSCKYFRNAVLNSSVIWKQKFHENWPKFVHLFDNCSVNYFEEVQYIYNLKNRVICLLEQMPQRFYRRYQLSDTDFEQWADLIREKEQTYHYLVMTLVEIVNTNESIKSIEVVPLNTPGNKTLQYYASKALRFVKQSYLSSVWKQYTSLALKKQTLEKGAIFVAQWCQTDLEITEEKIQAELDFIANLVKRRLFNINPDHHLLKTPEAEMDTWKYENLDKCQWSIPECRQLIVAMREVMYSELGFHGNQDNYYMSENSLINKVLERGTGLPILLAIIYESVGRRLGVLFQPIDSPAHFLLRFTAVEGSNRTVYYIDAFNGGDVLRELAVSGRALFPVASSVQVIERIVNNLELSTRQIIEPNGRVTFLRAILELLVLVSPQDISAIVSLVKLYSLHKVNTKSLEDHIMAQKFDTPSLVENTLVTVRGLSKRYLEVENEFQLYREAPVIERPPHVKYAVGMVMTDIAQNDKCLIFGWSTGCPAASECPATCQWPATSQKQLIYHVLVEDGSYRYAPQDMLVPSLDPGSLHLNKDLGRHFSHFFENHYVPNAEKERQYPHDTRVRHKFYHDMLLTHYQP